MQEVVGTSGNARIKGQATCRRNDRMRRGNNSKCNDPSLYDSWPLSPVSFLAGGRFYPRAGEKKASLCFSPEKKNVLLLILSLHFVYPPLRAVVCS